MVGLVAGLVADAVIGYAEDKLVSIAGDAVLDWVGYRRSIDYITDLTRKVSEDIKISNATILVLNSNSKDYKKVRKGFAISILKKWESENVKWFVTTPPCD